MSSFKLPSAYDFFPGSDLPLIDIGANLTSKLFTEDLPAVLRRAADVSVNTLVITGTNIKESQEAVTLAARYPGRLYSTSGVHPHDAKNYSTNSSNDIKQLAKRPEVKAIGECGLDFNRMYSPKELQIKAFEAQIELAIELQLPLFLHERDAHQQQLEILSCYRDQFPAAVIHCFTGSKRQCFNYLDLDLHIGITGWICDERRGTHLHNFVADIPLNRLMIETDAPYLTPRVKPRPTLASKRRNEPCTLPYVLLEIDRHHSADITTLAKACTSNAIDFFNLEPTAIEK